MGFRYQQYLGEVLSEALKLGQSHGSSLFAMRTSARQCEKAAWANLYTRLMEINNLSANYSRSLGAIRL